MFFLSRFFNEDDGQDLIDYALLVAFVALASSVLFIDFTPSHQGRLAASPVQSVANQHVNF